MSERDQETKIENTTDENIKFLLEYCSKIPELYNDVSNHLYDRFGIIGAEICLLITYYVNEERKLHG